MLSSSPSDFFANTTVNNAPGMYYRCISKFLLGWHMFCCFSASHMVQYVSLTYFHTCDELGENRRKIEKGAAVGGEKQILGKTQTPREQNTPEKLQIEAKAFTQLAPNVVVELYAWGYE